MSHQTQPYQFRLADFMAYGVGSTLASWAHPTRGWPSFVVPSIGLLCLGLFQYAARLPLYGSQMALIMSVGIVAAVCLAGIAVILLMICLRTYGRWRRVARDPRLAHARVIRIDTDGLHLERGGETTLWPWTETKPVTRVGSQIGVQVSLDGQIGIHLMPLRAFGSKAEQRAFFEEIQAYQASAPVVSVF